MLTSPREFDAELCAAFRPVWIEAVPERWIEHVAVDARADGNLTADVTLGNSRENKRPDGQTLIPERIEAQVMDDHGKAVGEVITRPGLVKRAMCANVSRRSASERVRHTDIMRF